jgi:Flp pilus assembly pilin Flp
MSVKKLIDFCKDDCGQDVVEYSLLLGFVCVAGAAAFVSFGGFTTAIWSAVNNRMASANQSS